MSHLQLMSVRSSRCVICDLRPEVSISERTLNGAQYQYVNKITVNAIYAYAGLQNSHAD